MWVSAIAVGVFKREVNEIANIDLFKDRFACALKAKRKLCVLYNKICFKFSSLSSASSYCCFITYPTTTYFRTGKEVRKTGCSWEELHGSFPRKRWASSICKLEYSSNESIDFICLLVLLLMFGQNYAGNFVYEVPDSIVPFYCLIHLIFVLDKTLRCLLCSADMDTYLIVV